MSGNGTFRRHGRALQRSTPGIESEENGGPPAKARRKGKTIDRGREVSPFGQAFVDNVAKAFISEDLVARVAHKALQLKIA